MTPGSAESWLRLAVRGRVHSLKRPVGYSASSRFSSPVSSAVLLPRLRAVPVEVGPPVAVAGVSCDYHYDYRPVFERPPLVESALHAYDTVSDPMTRTFWKGSAS